MAASDLELGIRGDYQLNALLNGWKIQQAWHRARLDLVARVMPPIPGTLALDAAAGSGIVTWRFPTASIISADVRASACQTVRQHTPGARAAAADLCDLPFRAATFSQVYLLEVIEHLTRDDALRTLGELRRVSRTSARLLITTPNYRSLWIALEWLIDALHLSPPLADAQHITRYDKPALVQAVAASGWRPLRLGSFNVFAPLAGMLSHSAGQWAIDREVRAGVSIGALLYALCEAG